MYDYRYNYRRGSNTIAFAVIGAICMGITAILYITWLTATIKYMADPGNGYYKASDYIPNLLFVLESLGVITGSLLVGVSLFLQRMPALLMIGAGLAAFGNLIGLINQFYYFLKDPSGGTFMWVMTYLLTVIAWMMIAFLNAAPGRGYAPAIKAITIGAPALAFFLGLIYRIVFYNRNAFNDSFLSTYGKVTLCDIAITVGIIMVLFVILSRANIFGPGMAPPWSGPQYTANGARMDPPMTGSAPGTAFYGECGARLAPGMHFCTHCGAPVEPQLHQGNPYP